MTEVPAAARVDTPEPEEELALPTNKLGWLILGWRWQILLVAALLTLVAGYGARYLTFNPDTRAYFGPTNPERIALDHVEAKYAKATNVLIVLTPKDGNVFTPQSLSAVADITSKAWRTPYTILVDSLSNFQELKAKGEDLEVTHLYDGRKKLTPEDAAEVRKRALSNKEIVGRLLASNGNVTVINIMVSKPGKSPAEVKQIADSVRALADDVRKTYPGMDVRLTGGIMADLAFVEAAQRDTVMLVPFMALIIVGVLLVGMRSGTVAMVTSVVIAATVLITMGIYGWFGEVLNTVTAAAPPVIMTLYFADCVHFVMSCVQQQTHGRSRQQAIAETIRLHLVPILIKTATTIVGFLALNFSDSPPINQLGNVVAAGSLIGCILTITLIPAMLSYLPLPAYSESSVVHGWLVRMSNWVVAHNRKFLLGFAVLFPLLLLLIPRLQVDDNFVRYFDSSFQFRVDTDYMAKNVTGLHGLLYSVPAGAPEGITDPAYLRKLDAFAQWYRQQPNVTHVATLADIVRRINKAMNNDKPQFDAIPDDKKLIAQYLFLYELSLPPGQDLSTMVDVARSESMVNVRLADVSSNNIIDLANKGQAWLRENAAKEYAPATGMSLVYSYLTQRNIEAMMLGTAVSVLLVSLIMTFALRSWRLGWISLIVNLAPAAMAFGIWSLFGLQVNLAISVVTAITYGIVTDDTVHTMAKYRWARQMLGMSPPDAARETLTYTGSAVILSSVALAAGFGLLGFSSFNITSVMGILSALIISIAALAELFLLPGLLIKFDRGKL